MPSKIDEQKVSAQYARAVFEEAVHQQAVQPVFEDLGALCELMEQLPELASYWVQPNIPRPDKQELVKTSVEGKVHPLVANLVALMVENDRMSCFPGVLTAFRERLNHLNRTVTAEVTTAFEMDADLENRLRESLQHLMDADRVELSKRVEPGLLGGVILRLNDQVMDSSFIGKLETLRTRFS